MRRIIRIYLDTNYRIGLRQAAAGTPKCQAEAKLLHLLRERVASGTLFCPFSESIFLELLKQADTTSRMATAELIDGLSLGATLIEHDMRIGTEIAYLLHLPRGKESTSPLEHLIWCKPGYVLGFMHPMDSRFDPDTRLALQKAFFDMMWTASLSEVIALTDDADLGSTTDFTALAEELNCGIAALAGELRSFEQAYSAEVRGIVDLFGGRTMQVVQSMARREGISVDAPSGADRLGDEKQFRNLLILALEKDRARDVLRTLHILACLHASVRWDKKCKLDANDLLDFHHAAGALAYCDAFFTDGPLRTRVKQQHVALDQRYGCRVISAVEEAVDYLEHLN